LIKTRYGRNLTTNDDARGANRVSASKQIDSGIPMPLIASVRPIDAKNRLVEVTWAHGDRSGRTDVVDLSSLIDTHQLYRPLREDPTLFDTVHVVENGEAVGWADDAIDMSAESIERLATAGDF
jgi:hypothetical protein